MPEAIDVVVVGAGQAGLAVSHELKARGVEHAVLERKRIGQTWRERWESFCLVTPNGFIRLPGGEYAGDDPAGFMPRDDIVAYLESYAFSFLAPVREGVEIERLTHLEAGGFVLGTSAGDIVARTVVLATGAFQKPHLPEPLRQLPPDLPLVDVHAYRDPDSLPAGRILVVGSGQTGIQIAEELHEAGREVVLACGRAPWAPRRLSGRDIISWTIETPFLEQRLEDLPNPAARLGANIQASGHHGGHDLHYRVLQRLGITMTGRLGGVEEGRIHFAPDLAASVAFGDARYEDLCRLIRDNCAARGVEPPEFPEPEPFDASRAPASIRVADLAGIVVTSGFRPAYDWVRVPGAFDSDGFPMQDEGASTVAPGLFFCGVHFLRKRKSSLLYGVGEDAAVVAGKVAERIAA